MINKGSKIDPDVDGTSSDWALASGGAVNPVTDFEYDDATGELKITLDDGTEHTVTTISSGGDYDPIVDDATTMTEAVGGIDNGTTAGVNIDSGAGTTPATLFNANLLFGRAVY